MMLNGLPLEGPFVLFFSVSSTPMMCSGSSGGQSRYKESNECPEEAEEDFPIGGGIVVDIKVAFAQATEATSTDRWTWRVLSLLGMPLASHMFKCKEPKKTSSEGDLSPGLPRLYIYCV